MIEPGDQGEILDFLVPKGLIVVSCRKICLVHGIGHLTKFRWVVFSQFAIEEM